MVHTESPRDDMPKTTKPITEKKSDWSYCKFDVIKAKKIELNGHTISIINGKLEIIDKVAEAEKLETRGKVGS